MVHLPPSHYPNFGDLGEDLVTQWLQFTGWLILQRRFCCRWGEIDIIAEYTDVKKTSQEQVLAFVEVKTRSPGNWDAGGRGAITPAKQRKIARTAGMFLAKYPEKSEYICRFDVAIVSCQQNYLQQPQLFSTEEVIFSSVTAGYRLQLEEYIVAAFDASVDY